MRFVKTRCGRFRLGDLESILQLGYAQSRLRPIEVGAIERSEHLCEAETFLEEAPPERPMRPLQCLVTLSRRRQFPKERVGIGITDGRHSALASARPVILARIGTLAQ
jgi:hypothetical protein